MPPLNKLRKMTIAPHNLSFINNLKLETKRLSQNAIKE